MKPFNLDDFRSPMNPFKGGLAEIKEIEEASDIGEPKVTA